MMMPLGVDPAKLAEVQQVSRHVKAEIVADYNENTVSIKLSSENPQAALIVPDLVRQFAEGLATQLKTYFDIKGELIEIGKK